ncbi:MAG: phosphoribosylformylglycinamidine synthase subunit PurL [Chloroflexi bacterium]|nr:phosphoribosylformylglycinamidine synthase subunit PurL [Chloroflexota bacterium]
MPVTKEVLDEIALTEQEYRLIVERLEREPNRLELGLFGALWSEHCGYKHSRPLLKLFPTDSPRAVVRPGEENAGVVDIGDGLGVVMKVESHNHPSAVEPWQGAATGVGGIVRDILTMGARPVALLNSLRFGPLSDPHNRHLFEGVVGGISWYGNCIGVPDVAGEIAFSPSYSNNPLVNAMCVGVVRLDRLVRARASGPGNLLLLVGADTGRDGIHGASGLASRTFQGERELRPTDQVGNPILEKVLIEACLEATEACRDGIVGMQDLGAAGLTGSTVECAGRGGAGVVVDVVKVPRREAGMTPYEVMLSESQERMLLIVKPDWVERVKAVFSKWDLTSATIGQVTDDGLVRIQDDGKEVASLPVPVLVEAPQYRVRGQAPALLKELHSFDASRCPLPAGGPNEALLKLMASAEAASKRPVYRQYDHQVQNNTVVPPGAADATVLWVKGARRGPSGEGRGLALSIDGNGRYVFLDPYAGGAIAVAEACRNLVCVGAEPLAITDGLNFGDPERPDVAYQMEQCIQGMAAACLALGVPVVSGNVSLYNETDGQAIYPTPVVGALGLLDDVAVHATAAFKRVGDVVVLLGAASADAEAATLGGSLYLEQLQGQVAGRPSIDLELEARVQRLCREAVRGRLLSSAHDCSEGGLAGALAECCILGRLGLKGSFKVQGRWDAALFGEAQSRIVVSVPPRKLRTLERLAQQHDVPLVRLGRVGGEQLVVPGLLTVPVAELAAAWCGGLA